MENGPHVTEEPDTAARNSVTESTPERNSVTESESKRKKPQVDSQNENIDALIECVMKHTGFSQGKPVAAFTIYKCLIHWKSFESEKTSVYDRLIQMIGSAIKDQDNNDHMAYWLPNTSTLLFLIQKSLKPDGTSSVRKPPPPTSLFGRMTMVAIFNLFLLSFQMWQNGWVVQVG